MAELKFAPISPEAVREIFTWRYQAPWDMYNFSAQNMKEQLPFFLDPSNAYYEGCDADGKLVLYCCFGADATVPGGDYSQKALDIGMGLHPDLTGQGNGHRYAAEVLELAREIEDASHDRVTIAEFNLRARRVWQKLGFDLARTFERQSDDLPFVILTRKR